MKTFSSVLSHRQRGFSLLEVLIAVLILSIGLMGLAGLQVVSVKGNQNAMLRSIASEAAYDLMDQFRANAQGTVNVDAWRANLKESLPSVVDDQTGVCITTTVAPCAAYPAGTAVTATGAGMSPGKVFLHVRVQWNQAAVNAKNFSTDADELAQGSATDAVQQVTITGQL